MTDTIEKTILALQSISVVIINHGCLVPNLHNLTSASSVMLLANKRLPYGNQILARIFYVSFEINFREKEIFKYVHVQMALPNVLFLR